MGHASYSDEARSGYTVREFEVEVTTDRNVTGALWIPDNATPGAPLVLCGHGGSGDRHAIPVPYLAKHLAREHGAFTMAIDGPVHGRRKVGTGDRMEFWKEWHREGTVEDMNADWTAALDWTQQQPEVGTGPVGYWGVSMGTIYGAPFVANEPRVAAAVLGLMGISGPDRYKPTIQAAAQAIDVPVFFLMQLEDELFGRSECIELFDAIGSADKRLHANPGEHVAIPVNELVESLDFLMLHLATEATT